MYHRYRVNQGHGVMHYTRGGYSQGIASQAYALHQRAVESDRGNPRVKISYPYPYPPIPLPPHEGRGFQGVGVGVSRGTGGSQNPEGFS
jgi:hypothetical protein